MGHVQPSKVIIIHCVPSKTVLHKKLKIVFSGMTDAYN